MTEQIQLEDFLANYGLGQVKESPHNTTAVIVALPRDLDSVRLIGDEEKHATLMYFGETSSLPEHAKETILQVLTLAASMQSPFVERVINIERLGSDNPPALVAKLNGRCLPKIRQMMQIVPDINVYLGNADQYPSYTPHVTVAYPNFRGEFELREKLKDLHSISFDRLALWWNDEHFDFPLADHSEISEEMAHADISSFLEHYGVKGQKWGFRRDERLLSDKDKALNLSQRSQVKLASGISALATVGLTSNAAAALFQLQSRFEHLQLAKQAIAMTENHPLMTDATREAVRLGKSRMVKGLIASAVATTAISAAIGIVTHRTAKAYFAPIHKVYGDAKPAINRDLRRLSKDIKSGKRSKMTNKQYEAEVSKIVEKHMTKDMVNVVKPFHELARSQLGLEYNTKKLNITFSKLPNTNLASKMTVTTPTGLKLVKAIKVVEHSEDEGDVLLPDMDIYFDYKFDSDGFVEEWWSPTMDISEAMFEGTLDVPALEAQYDPSASLQHTGDFLEHYGIKGMRWGVRRDPSGTHADGAGKGYSKKEAKKAPVGTIRESVDEHGQKTYYMKKKDGTWGETYFSEDQRRAIKLAAKAPHELSTAELREVTARREALSNYNKLFNPTPAEKSDIQLKIERMELQKKYRDLNAALNPPKPSPLAKAFGHLDNGFKRFNTIDKILGGQLSKGITRQLGLEPQLTAAQKLKAKNEFLKLRKNNVELQRSLVEYGDLHANTLDAPSLATNYSGAGKRRKKGRRSTGVGLNIDDYTSL